MFTARKDTHGATVGLSDPITIKFFVTESSSLEVEVIKNSPLDTSSCEIGCHARIPDSFGNPHACDCGLETLLEPVVVLTNLADSVA